jgi:HAD superfamily phosphoserine phosphatase-like hydrolase
MLAKGPLVDLGMIIAADLEGTLSTGESWRALERYLETHSSKGAYRRFKLGFAPKAMLARVGLADERAFKNRWLSEMIQLFRDQDEAAFREIAEWVVEHELWPQRREDVLKELLARQKAGWLIILASGTYQPILEAFAERIGAEALGTELELQGGKLTGKLIGSVNVGRVKAERLLVELDGETVYAAYGDSEADIPMLQLAEEPVAVHPDAALKKIAKERGWRIIE